MKVFFAEDAERDLFEIARWIAEDDPAIADSFAAELRRACLELGSTYRLYPVRFLLRGNEIRRRNFKRYAILLRVGKTGVEILRVLHGARDIGSLLPPA